jgi:hypothetical protein
MKKIKTVTKLLVSNCILFLACSAFAEPEQFNFDPNDFDKVSITHASGQIHIQNPELTDSAHLNIEKGVSNHDCETSYEIIDRVLYLKTEKKLFVIKSECSQDLDLFVSKDKSVKVSLGVGSIHFSGLFPSLQADLGSGDISVRGKVSNLDLDVASGSVSVSGLDGYGKITLLSGNLDVKYDAPKKKFNQLFVSKSVGNTSIQIPKGTKAESKLKTLLGQISNGTNPSPKGEFYFSVKTNVGDILMNTY